MTRGKAQSEEQFCRSDVRCEFWLHKKVTGEICRVRTSVEVSQNVFEASGFGACNASKHDASHTLNLTLTLIEQSAYAIHNPNPNANNRL